jgi:hypothetical protein
MRFLKYGSAALAILLIVVAIWITLRMRKQREWFDLQAQQLATIKRLGDSPPPGWQPRVWQSAVGTPYNVWLNVTYHPDYSKISIEEMRLLQGKLEEIVSQTTPENSLDSVDRVFQLLLERGRRTEFISGYRDEVRSYAASRNQP